MSDGAADELHPASNTEVRAPLRWRDRFDGSARDVLRSDYGALIVGLVVVAAAGLTAVANSLVEQRLQACGIKAGGQAVVVSEVKVLAAPVFESRTAAPLLLYGHPVNIISGPEPFHSNDPAIGDILYWYVKNRHGTFGWVAETATNAAGTMTFLAGDCGPQAGR